MATINKMSSLLVRKSLQQQKHHLRCAGGNGIVHRFKSSKVDLEHYESGWNIDDIGEFKHQGGKFTVQTYNKLSPKGLERFPSELYEECKPASETSQPAHALMLRSHKLQESEVDIAVRAIARCGAGTNNIPVAKMTELGIPVFNTPGANANAVKELILCGLFLGSRRVIDGINHMTDLGQQGLAREKVEKDKAMFGGREIAGKKLAVIGLGNIGAAAARDAAASDAAAASEDLPEEIRCANLSKTMKGSLLRQVGGAKVAGINFSAKTTLEVREWPTGMPDFAHFLDEMWEGKSRDERAREYPKIKLKRYRFPRPFALSNLPTRDISMQSIANDDGEFRLYQGVWRMQPLVGCSPPGRDAMRLTYAVEISPRVYLPVKLIEGRIVRDLCSNLEAIREAVTTTVNGSGERDV